MAKKRLSKEELEDIETWQREREALTTAKMFTNKIEIKCRSKAQKDAMNAIENHDISIVTGPPGTGKTYLSCARALKYLKEDPGTYKKIILIKSVNVPKDEEIGYLKGTLEENDEAQQIAKDHLHTLITRIGNDSKMVFLGDIKQKSVNKGQKSALEILMEYFVEIEEIGIAQLSNEDIVRHPIIKKIEEVFEKIENNEKLNK